MIPTVGGIIEGTFDGVSTNIVRNVARKTFIKNSPLINTGNEKLNKDVIKCLVI